MILYATLAMAAVSFAQTPVSTVMVKYGSVKGAQDFSAKGGKMNIVRGIIRKSPVGPVADSIDELFVLKLSKASAQNKNSFLTDLKSALKDYEYQGKEPYNDSVYEIYILRSGADVVKDLVMYNPEAYSLNSLQGTISFSELAKLSRK